MTVNLRLDFRNRCEAIATDIRYTLGRRAYDPLPADDLACHLGALILTPDGVPGLEPEHVRTLLTRDTWSAAILSREPLVILANPAHSPARRESDLMHEFAHVLLDHSMTLFDAETGLPRRDPKTEREAEFLGSCLQVPCRGLRWARQRAMGDQAAAGHFGASLEMIDYRAKVCGVQP